MSCQLFPFSRSLCPSHKIAAADCRACHYYQFCLFITQSAWLFCSIKLTPIQIVSLEWSGCCCCYFAAINTGITKLHPLQDYTATQSSGKAATSGSSQTDGCLRRAENLTAVPLHTVMMDFYLKRSNGHKSPWDFTILSLCLSTR